MSLRPLPHCFLPTAWARCRQSLHARVRVRIRAAVALTARLLALLLPGLVLAMPAHGFCGFYVSSADTKLYNEASQVVLMRDGQRTVMTMANDFRGDVRDFAMVVPIPTALRREQINVADRALIEHIDAYTAPRLVEYFDSDPCRREVMYESARASAPTAAGSAAADMRREARALGVRIEASYTVGEYDILVLSAAQSDGLVTWLTRNGYRLPAGAAQIAGSYLRQGMRFFVAKVNLREQARSGFSRLRPLQIAYEHPRFMLPIRLGTVNANGPQELFVYGLTRTGRIETTNYRTVALPTDVNLPEFVQPSFADFYRTMFREQTRRANGEVVFLESAWDMTWCDPCAADALSPAELKQLGVFWLDAEDRVPAGRRVPRPSMAPAFAPGGPLDVFVTRLHVRYDAAHFPEDLMLKVTGNRTNFQGRYVLQRAWSGAADCPEARSYFSDELPRRREQEVQTLARLTGWKVADLRRRLPAIPEYRGHSNPAAAPERPVSRRVVPRPVVPRPGTRQSPPEPDQPWWERLWD